MVIAKFHYTDPTGPARTQRSFAAKKSVRVRSGPCRVRVRVRVVEFSYNGTTLDIFRLHIARSAADEDHHRAVAAAIRQPPSDWKRPPG